MKIAVFGTGVVGQTLAEKLVSLGHEVIMGTRHVNDALSRTGNDNFGRPAFNVWHKSQPSIKLTTFAEAAKHAELNCKCYKRRRLYSCVVNGRQ